jgi:methanethiol oxidase
MAMQAPAETLAYVALLNPDPTGSDALAVLNLDPASPGYGAQIARVDMPYLGTRPRPSRISRTCSLRRTTGRA